MVEKRAVIVSRRWDHPAISVSVTVDGISIAMSLDKFVDSLGEEMGSPAALFTRAAFRERLKAAADAVVVEMKNTSVAVM